MTIDPNDVPADVADRFALVRAELHKLAIAPQLIPYHFEFYEITGTQGAAVGDPLQQWLECRTGCDIAVGPNVLTASIAPYYTTMNLPAAIMCFIRDFDAGLYPTLIATETGAPTNG